MSDTAEDKYCPYCRAKLTKPNDCDICGMEFLRADALTEAQAQNWEGREVDTRVAFTCVGIFGFTVVLAFCLVMAVRLRSVGDMWIFGIIASVAISMFAGAVVSLVARSKMAMRYGRMATAPLKTLSSVLLQVGVVISGPPVVFILSGFVEAFCLMDVR